MFANGNLAQDFIICEEDRFAAFNRFGTCKANNPDVSVVAFCIEDSHIHSLLYGTYAECLKYCAAYEKSSIRHIAATRGQLGDVRFRCELATIEDNNYLMNVATYIIVQPTKDGQAVMPFDYLWGTGPLYFRNDRTILPWFVSESQQLSKPVQIGTLSKTEQRRILHSKTDVPDHWLVCNGFLLPQNYLDIGAYEKIFRTHNRYLAFLASAKKLHEPIVLKMADVSGVSIKDNEAREIKRKEAKVMFGTYDVRSLTINQRLQLAMEIRRKHSVSYRQLSFMVHLPVIELRKYIK